MSNAAGGGSQDVNVPLSHTPTPDALPSLSATPSSTVFGPNGDSSALYTRFARDEVSGVTVSSGSHVVELRGWITEVPPVGDSTQEAVNWTDPDCHYTFLIDPDWALAQGHDLGTLIRVGDILGQAFGDADANAAARRPTVKIEINGLPINADGTPATSFDPPSTHHPPRTSATPSDWTFRAHQGPRAVLNPDWSDVVWPYPVPVMGSDGHLIAVNDYVRVSGSLVTDGAHDTKKANASDSYIAAVAIWRAKHTPQTPDSKFDPSRWTEVHPPDTIQRVSELPPGQQTIPGNSQLMGVVVCCPADLVTQSKGLTVDLRPDPTVSPGVAAKVGQILQVEEHVNPDTVYSSIVEGNAARNGAAITRYRDHVTVHVKVQNTIPWVAPGKFAAVYRMWWQDPPAPPNAPNQADRLEPGEGLLAGQYLHTLNGFRLTLQADANIVATGQRGTPYWSSGTTGWPDPFSLDMQGDGNLVAYDIYRQAFWSTGTDGNAGAYALLREDGSFVVCDSAGAVLASPVNRLLPTQGPAPARPDRLQPGEALVSGQQLQSPNGFALVLQPDGNLVLHAPGGEELWRAPLWVPESPGTPWQAIQQVDGNFVIYDAATGAATWATGQDSGDGNWLHIQGDGNLVQYGPDGGVLFATNTAVAQVPSVVGLNPTDAVADIHAAGLTWTVAETRTGGERPTVVGQHPSGGAWVAPGTQIELTIEQPGHGPQN